MTPAALVLALALPSAEVRLEAYPTPVSRGVRLQPDQTSGDTLAEIRVQGNTVTPEAEIERLAQIEIGMTVSDATADEAAARLRATKRFERVEVLKRFASISDPTRIVLVIIVDEGPVKIEFTGDPDNPTRVVKKRFAHLLWLPILGGSDGYGVTYGVQAARVDPAGPHSRLSFPVSWGGVRQGGVDLDKLYDQRPIARLRVGVLASETENPFYEVPDHRIRVYARAEHAFRPTLRIGGTIGWQHLTFNGETDRFAQEGVDAVIDTRIDPFLARNAVYARASVDRFHFTEGATDQLNAEAHWYIGVPVKQQPILVLSAARSDADRPLPDAFRPLLGGFGNVRGFEAGSASGDTFAAASAEVLVPLNSPLSFGKFGVSTFVDTGAVYDKGEHLADQHLRTGVGGGIWFAAAFLRLDLSVAHGIGAGNRVHFGVVTSF